MTVEYLRTILLFAPAYFLNNLVLAFLRNDGAPRLAMAAMLSGSIANIFLDYLFIFPLGMGMFGAALATGIAPCIGLAVQSLHFLRGKNGFSLRRTLPDVRQALGILSLGASSFVLELSSGVVLLTFNMLLLRISGNMGVAAYGVVANIALVVIALFTGVSQGMQPVLSGCFSRGGHRSAALVYRAAVVTALALAAAAWLLGSLFAGPVVSLFNREGDRELARLAVSGIRIYFVSFPFAGINIVTAAAMSARRPSARGLPDLDSARPGGDAPHGGRSGRALRNHRGLGVGPRCGSGCFSSSAADFSNGIKGGAWLLPFGLIQRRNNPSPVKLTGEDGFTDSNDSTNQNFISLSCRLRLLQILLRLLQ